MILLAAWSATAASSPSNGIPGSQDYAKFTAFIADRNIFDPSRQPHNPTSRPSGRHPRRAAPGIQFVGTMSYDKGRFAFFSGNSSDLSKVVRVGDTFLNYTVAAVCSTNVVLEATNQTQINIGLGGGLKENNGVWVSVDAGDVAPAAGAAETAGAPDTSGSVSEATPPSASEPNDILKRLMQQREKENQ